MRNDISIVRAAAGVAALALALGGCGSDAPRPDETMPPPAEQAAPEISATEGEGSGSGDAVALRENAPLRYVVKKGDTLWDIANKFLKDSWQWPEVWTANEKVANPHLIYPGDELYLYYVDGAPRVSVATGPGGEAGPAEVLPAGGMGDMRPRTRESALDQAIYSIPLDAIRAFLKGPRMIDEDLLDDAPYLLAFQSDKLLGGSDEIAYALGVEDTAITQYQVVRKGEEYEDPDDGDTIGFEVLPVADADVRVFGDPATIFLRRSDMEARAGDYLLPLEQDPLSTRFVPHAPDKPVDGKIISVYNGVSQIGQYQVVAINRGTEQGMEPGHVLSVLQTGRKAKDPYSILFIGGNVRLPEQKAGTIMVFKTAPRMSYALVMSATQPIHLLDKVEKPEPSN